MGVGLGVGRGFEEEECDTNVKKGSEGFHVRGKTFTSCVLR